jgi:YwiC-like protein
MALLPKEHGAYGQMAFPLLTALLVGGANTSALAWTVGVVAAFVAHEPALILLGRRGPRARREHGRQAMVAALLVGALAVAGGLVAFFTAPADARWAFAVPAVPACLVGIVIARDREKSAVGELAVAATFSLAAVPPVMSAGAESVTAFTVALVFGVVFSTAVLAVRTVVARGRGRGTPAGIRATCAAIVGVSAAPMAGLWWISGPHLVPWIPLAVVPAVFFALWVTISPPPPQRLRELGWSIVAVTTFATLMLVAGLRAG